MPALIGSVASVATRSGGRLPRRALLMAGAAAAALLVTPDAARAACAPDAPTTGMTVNCIGADTNGLTVTGGNVTTYVRAGATVTGVDGAEPFAIGYRLGTGDFGHVVVDGAVSGAVTGDANDKYGLYFEGGVRADVRVGTSGVVAGSRAIYARGVGTEVRVTNEGRIEGTEGGSAMHADSNAEIHLVNRQGGIVAGGIVAGGMTGRIASIENAGTITGGVNLAGSPFRTEFYHRIGGVVQGEIVLGGNDDTFFLEWRNGAAATGVDLTRLKGGGGDRDAFGYKISGSGPNGIVFGDLPNGFERYALDLCGCDTDVTVGPRADGTAYNNALDITGEGRVAIQGNFSVGGQALTIISRKDDDNDDASDFALDVTNSGRLEASNADNAIYLDGADGGVRLTNAAAGVISLNILNGNTGISAFNADLVNVGRITGAFPGDDGVGIEHADGLIDNRGTISFTGGNSALQLGVGSTLLNSGEISWENTGGSEALYINGGKVVNRSGGRITATSGNAALLQAGAILVNEAGAGITGDIRLNPGTSISNAGQITGNLEAGFAFIHLAQGSNISGNVTFSAGDEILVVDADRVDATGRTGSLDLTGLIGGTFNNGGGTDTLWVQATSNRTINVLDHTVAAIDVDGNAATVTDRFGQVVYEASGNDTTLTLAGTLDVNNNPDTIERQIRIVGDGRVEIVSNILVDQPDARSGLVVEEGSTLSRIGQAGSDGLLGDGRLDVVLTGTVGARANVGIDAQNASSLEIRNVVDITSASLVSNGLVQQYGIQAGSADVRVVGPLGQVSFRTTDGVNTVGIDSDGGSVYTDRIISEVNGRTTADSTFVTGVRLADSNLEVDTNGTVRVRSAGAVAVEANTATIVNRGDIISEDATGTAIRLSGFINTVRNMAGATIQTGTGPFNTVAAITGLASDDIIVNSGDIRGNVSLGGGSNTYLWGNDTATISGVINGGSGTRDAYGRSFDASATYQLANAALVDTATRTGFELHGVEANGEGVTVTLTGDGLTNGVRLLGSGTIVSQANITTTDNGFEAYSALGLQAFVNSGTVTAGGIAFNGSSGIRSFSNSGTLISTGGITAVHLQYAGEADAPLTNSGTIRNDSTAAGADAWLVEALGGEVSVANTGANAVVSAAGGAALTVDAYSASVTNSGSILASGIDGLGVQMRTGADNLLNLADCTVDELQPPVLAALDNSGTIRVSGGGTNNVNDVDSSVAVLATLSDEVSAAQITNRAGATIQASGTNAVAVLVKGTDGDLTDTLVAGRVSLTNEGTISGTGVANADVNVVNGNLLETATFTDGAYRIGGAIHTVDTVDSIVNAATGTISGDVVLGAGDDEFTNLGTINGNVYMGDDRDVFRGGGTINGDVRLGEGDDTFVILAGLALNGTVYGGDGIDRLTVELSGDTSIDPNKFREFEIRAARVGDGREASVNADYTAFDTIFVEDGILNVTAGPVLTTASTTTITGGDTTNDTVNIAAGGGVAGSIVLGGGDDVVSNAGTIGGSVDLGAGNDRYVSLGGTVAGTIDGGAGTDTFEFLLTADASAAPTGIVNFESLAVRGAHRLTLTTAQAYDTLELLDGADLTLNAGGGSVTNILGDGSDNDVVLNTAVAGRIALGGGNDALTLTVGGTLGDIDGGEGTDVLNATLTQALTIANLAGFETANFTGASPVTFTGTISANQTVNFDGSDNSLTLASGAELLGNVNGGAGRDVLTLETAAPTARTIVAAQVQNFEDLVANGSGTVALTGAAYGFQTVAVNGGNLSLGTGTALTAASVTFDGANNVLSLASGASIGGTIDGGAGNDTLALVQDGGFTRSLSALNATNFEALSTSGAGALTIDRNATFASGVTLSGGTTTVAAGSTLTANVTGSDAAETFAALGTLAGHLDLGAGNDRLVVAAANAITGTRAGGAGSDTLAFASGGTYAAPTVWDGQGYSGFEVLENTAGTTSLTGNASFETVNVVGGRLIGQAGTTLTASGGINVAAGATFGSAGTVNGNIAVAGTLSPGASPGTMTVNGNVSFASGSNLLLELTPTAQDLLDISGTLTIAQGATVDITGVLDNLPGRVLDLVVADGGITGSFTTVNKSSTVFGFVAQNGNRIQLRGEFQNSAAYVKNVQASIDYANTVLRSGQLVQAFTGALPRLIDANGVSNAQAFGQLTPEAYASASQIGLQNGLAVTDAARSLSMTTPHETGFFAFGQGIANWGDLAPQNRVTVGKGDVDTAGVIGGVGFGFEDGGRVGAFLGYLDAEQKLGALDASTSADGLVGGVFADAAYGGFGLHALVAYSQADAETNRTLAAAQATARGGYDLGTWIADATIDYRAELGGALVMAPKLGLTYVRTKRDGLTETGGGAFGLSVAGRSYETLYGDAAIAVSTKATLGGMGFTPYGEFGIRHRLEGDQMVAIGRFAGATGDDRLTVDGVGYGKTVARVGTGFGLDVAPNVRLNAGYGYEMGQNDRHTVTGGLSVRF